MLKKLKRKFSPVRPPSAQESNKLFHHCEVIFRLILRNRPKSDAVIKKFRKRIKSDSKHRNHFVTHRDAWILAAGYETLNSYFKPGTGPSLSELADPIAPTDQRLSDLDHFIEALDLNEQWVLFAYDRFGIDFKTLAISLGRPEESVKALRAHALQNLERWIWQQT